MKKAGVFYEVVETGTKYGFPYYSVEFWRTENSYKDGEEPYLLNDFVLQIRTEHQRIKITSDYKSIHSSGAEFDISKGNAAQRPYFVRYRINPDRTVKTNESGQWIRENGSAVTPFEYKHGSVTEYLDPQWQRELFTVPLIDQAIVIIEDFIERALLRNWKGDRRGTTVSVNVAASGDDAAHHSVAQHTYYATSGANQVGRFNGNQANFGSHMRFLNMTIPQGSTIDAAKMTMRVRNTQSATVINTRIRAEDVDTAGGPDHTMYDSTDKTTEEINWDSIPAHTAGDDEDTPDFKAVVQELTDRGGWSSGNAMVIYWDDNDQRTTQNDGTRRIMNSYDQSSANNVTLIVDHSTPVAATHRRSPSGGATFSGGVAIV